MQGIPCCGSGPGSNGAIATTFRWFTWSWSFRWKIKAKFCWLIGYYSFTCTTFRDHSYITSSHFWDFWTPLPPCVSMFLLLRIIKNWHFLTPLPLQVLTYIIYEWSLNRQYSSLSTLVKIDSNTIFNLKDFRPF